MVTNNGIFAWIAGSMFNMVYKRVQKHYEEQGHKKPKSRWGYGTRARKEPRASSVSSSEPQNP